MTEAAPAVAGEAQPIADANPVDTIINNAETESPTEPSSEPTEPPDEPKEELFPKKAINALSKRDKQIGKLRAERDAMKARLSEYEQSKPQQQNDLSPAKTGIPTKLNANNFANYAEFIEARAEEIADYKIDKKLAERDVKQQETQRSSQDQAWESERLTAIDKQSEEFTKEFPDVTALFDEYADVIKEYPAQIKRLFMEADNAPLAFYNLAKEGKIEDLGDMSYAKAAMEIGRAQTQAPLKPKTKAPTPLPASRGSVPAGKSLDSMSGDELLKWVDSKG